MPETIYKLEPHRTIHLRGFSGNGAAGALTQTSATGFKLSGVFRDAADFAVLILWDEDDFFGHPRLKYLPDSNFAGMVLSFDMLTTKLSTIDSAKSPTITWPYLSYILENGTAGTIPLLANATQTAGTYTSGSGTFTIGGTPSAGNWVAVWFTGLAFQAFMPAGSALVRTVTIFAGPNGTVNTLTIGGSSYSHTTAGDSSAGVAAILAGMVTNPEVTATTGGTNVITVTPVLNTGAVIAIDGANLWVAANPPQVLATDLASQINGASYTGTYKLTAVATGAALAITAKVAADGRASGRDGNMIRMYGQSIGGLSIDALVTFAGGSSAATWTVSLNFTVLGIDTPRQLWLTFAPELADSAAYAAEEWTALFSNWAVTDPSGHRPLKVAGPGSVRVEDSDSWCAYLGASWGLEAGIFYSKGFARRAAAIGDRVTVDYWCSSSHDLWIGTSLYSDRGKWGVSLDGDAETLLDCYLAAEPAVVTRRSLLRTGVAAGHHTVVLTVRAKSASSTGNNCYFDFLEAVIAGDVPDAPGPWPTSSPAIDYDTDHGFKLSPQRLLWMFDKLGFTGPMNEYIGVFWWNQRSNVTAVFPSVVVTIAGSYIAGDTVSLVIGGITLGKTVFAPDTLTSIAAHFVYFINETFVGVWASAAAGVLTIVNRSPGSAYSFTFSASKVSAAGTVAFTGSLAGTPVSGTLTANGTTAVVWVSGSTFPILVGNAITIGGTGYTVATYTDATHLVLTATVPAGVGTAWSGIAIADVGVWLIDPTQTPEVNVAARNWHADLYAEVAARGLTIVTSFSMELVNPPDDPAGGHVWAARFVDHSPVTTATGFGGLLSTQCAPEASEFLAYQKNCFKVMAGLQNAAGLTPELQFGEFEWWFFANASGMAYYDAETAAAAAIALGGALHTFLTPDDDPSLHAPDALFLRNRLRDHAAAIGTFVRATYATAKFELLYPYDVNYPSVYGRYGLGGRLNAYVNLPVEWKTKAGSGLDRVKIEALDFGSGTHSLDLVLQAVNLATSWGWALADVRYLFPVFNGGCPLLYEQQIAQTANTPFLTPFAMDHVCLMGWDLSQTLIPDAHAI